MPTDGITPVVLAGGESTRFEDGHKAGATLDGRSLLRHVLDAVEDSTPEPPVLVFRSPGQRRSVLAAVGDVTGDRVEMAVDAEPFAGPVAGLYGALEAVETPWLCLCACDMPLVSAGAVDSLAGRRTAALDAVVPVDSTGGSEPLFALYRCESLRAVEAELPPTPGVRALVDRLDRVETVSVDSAPPGSGLSDATTNVNTLSDLTRLSE